MTIRDYLEEDHRRLEALLAAGSDDEFRKGLLRHISIEEKILLPAARRLRGSPVAAAARLRADHGAIAALLVPTPTARTRALLEKILTVHDEIEEGDAGVYAECERLAIAAGELDELVAKMRAAPEVKAAAHFDGDAAWRAIERKLLDAGYSPEP